MRFGRRLAHHTQPLPSVSTERDWRPETAKEKIAQIEADYCAGKAFYFTPWMRSSSAAMQIRPELGRMLLEAQTKAEALFSRSRRLLGPEIIASRCAEPQRRVRRVPRRALQIYAHRWQIPWHIQSRSDAIRRTRKVRPMSAELRHVADHVWFCHITYSRCLVEA